jgi:hypothetical protein
VVQQRGATPHPPPPPFQQEAKYGGGGGGGGGFVGGFGYGEAEEYMPHSAASDERAPSARGGGGLARYDCYAPR